MEKFFTYLLDFWNYHQFLATFIVLFELQQFKIIANVLDMKFVISINVYATQGTIIRTRTTCKKIPCCMHNSACRFIAKKPIGSLLKKLIGLLLKNLKYLEVMLNISEFSRVRENGASWLVYANKLFELPKTASYFSKDIIKQNLCQLVFLTFQTFSQKNKVLYKLLF